MAVSVTSVEVLDNPSAFTNPLQFEIQYECLHQLAKDLEWKLIYVGSAESEAYDQVLDSVLVGPVYPGQYRFVFQANPPEHSKLPQEDIVGITVILLTCSYDSQEFIRIGYYVNNEYQEEELREEPPAKPIIDKLYRNILANKPRVTKFPVQFDDPPEGSTVPSSAADEPQQLAGSYGGGGVEDEEVMNGEEEEEEEEEEEDDDALPGEDEAEEDDDMVDAMSQ